MRNFLMENKINLVFLLVFLGCFYVAVSSSEDYYNNMKTLKGGMNDFDFSEKRYESVENFSDIDVQILARVLQSECYLADSLDHERVASVVVNRMKSSKFPNTLEAVVFKPKQFHGVNTKNFHGNIHKRYLKVAKDILEKGPILPPNILGYYNPKKSTNLAHVHKVQDFVLLKGKHHWYHYL